MKKKHILTSIALTLLLSFMLISCNADATAGLFRQISESKAPVGIVYKQIVGLDTTAPKTLYYLTDEGLLKTDGTSSTKLVANAEENIITIAYLDGSTTIAYQVNKNANNGYKVIKTTDVSGVAGTSYDFSAFENAKLLPNGLVLTKDSSHVFELYDYDDTTAPTISIGTYTDYDLSSVVQLSGKEHDVTTPMLVSLVNESGNYKHVYVDGSATELATSTSGMRFTAMSVANASLYLMELDDTEGIIYKANDAANAITASTTFTKIHETAENYAMHAFMYGYYDSGTTQTKLITKPSGVNDALYVLSINSTDAVSASDKTDGYGEYLDAAEIVDSYEKSVNVLLVATLENGMYEIDIAGDDSSDSEEYTL
ncbi:hypothetical protein [uncultured Sphaerochaeta sp.]|uniref:hypothetical protein n=1 Tax=uncultured Sphaerochaeta sp. TaxID=886478 RepID=UPI002A0A1D4B|nr:hypothetical protein [uncultured Sphaerochaeta sp.]